MCAMPITGATVVGAKFADGVVLAAERRGSYGYFIASTSVRKVFPITKRIGLASAGLIADMQALVRELTAIARFRELQEGRPVSVRSIAKLTSILLYQNRLFPLFTQTVVGGYDEGPQLFSLDPLGSLLSDDYVAVGTGAEVALGILESEYRKGMSKEECVELVVKAIKSAIRRDAASGNGIDILVITKDGVEERRIDL